MHYCLQETSPTFLTSGLSQQALHVTVRYLLRRYGSAAPERRRFESASLIPDSYKASPVVEQTHFIRGYNVLPFVAGPIGTSGPAHAQLHGIPHPQPLHPNERPYCTERGEQLHTLRTPTRFNLACSCTTPSVREAEPG
jgi:hypothetical protein